MNYRIIVEKIDNALKRDVDQAAEDLSRQVRDQIANGWEPLGGIAVGSAGAAPYLLQAMMKR
jgi:hypothetical protein